MYKKYNKVNSNRITAYKIAFSGSKFFTTAFLTCSSNHFFSVQNISVFAEFIFFRNLLCSFKTICYLAKLSGIRGGCCNPSYWEDRIGGWPLCRRSAKGSKWLAEGPHYTVEWSDTSVPGAVRTQTPGGRPNSNLAAVRASVVFKLQLVWC